MLREHGWGYAGSFLTVGLCVSGLIGCAAGGGGGDQGGEAGGSVDVNFNGAAGGNFAVAKDDEGDEYTFRRNAAGQITEANIRTRDGQTIKASMDAQGRPVKFRSSDNSNADLIYDGDAVRIRYTPAAGDAREATGIDFKSARARVQRRRALQDKRQAAMQTSDGVNRLRSGLQTYDEVVESIFDEEVNPDNPLRGTAIEEPVQRVARVVSRADVREVSRDAIADVELDLVPSEIAALGGQTFHLFEAEGFCVDELGDAGGQPLIQSILTFDNDGILVAETDRKFLFDMGIGGLDRDIIINWVANTPVDLAVGPGLDYTAVVTPVFTGTQLDDDRNITLERRFLAEFTYEVEAFTTTEARTEQLFSAAFINGVVTGDVLEFDLVMIDLTNDTEPDPVAHLRYYNQNSIMPTDRRYPCDVATGQGEDAGAGLVCPIGADPFEFFTVEFADREVAADPDLARRLEYEWSVSSGYGYVEDATRFSQAATVVPTAQGLLEVSLVVSDPAGGGSFSLYGCEVRVGDFAATDIEFLNCPIQMNVSQADFFLAGGGGDNLAAGPRQFIGDGSDSTGGEAINTGGGDATDLPSVISGGGGTGVEWFVFGTSDFLVEDPFANQTNITFYEVGRFEVWLVVYEADGSESFASCEVSVDAAGFDECDEFGWYGDGICDDFCPLPDPDCRGAEVSDWCANAGFYGDGAFCDPDCPQPDPDCEGLDWCEAAGKYGNGVCDLDCPSPDPDCQETDYCADLGYYGDGICDVGCPSFDPDCDQSGGTDDPCEVLGYYGDGICDDFCPQPDPDCDVGIDVFGCSSDADCSPGDICADGFCLTVGDGSTSGDEPTAPDDGTGGGM